MSNRLGRRFTVKFMCVWTIACTTIVITSRNTNQILASCALKCLYLNYLYIGMEPAIIPLYQAEITPAPARGAMVAVYNTSLNIGLLFMSLIAHGTSN